MSNPELMELRFIKSFLRFVSVKASADQNVYIYHVHI